MTKKIVVRGLNFKSVGESGFVNKAIIEVPTEALVLDIRFRGSWQLWTLEEEGEKLTGPLEIIQAKMDCVIPDSIKLPPFYKCYTHQGEDTMWTFFVGNAY